uniref:Uncharacterized protein n=1 Tax=Glossina palpalis gambiensis TaxID=67801 RepID=A0A1B0BYL6_9MUSC
MFTNINADKKEGEKTTPATLMNNFTYVFLFSVIVISIDYSDDNQISIMLIPINNSHQLASNRLSPKQRDRAVQILCRENPDGIKNTLSKNPNQRDRAIKIEKKTEEHVKIPPNTKTANCNVNLH